MFPFYPPEKEDQKGTLGRKGSKGHVKIVETEDTVFRWFYKNMPHGQAKCEVYFN